MSETSRPAPQSGAEVLARVRPQLREESTQICLRPDLLDAHERAVEDLNAQQEKDATSGRLASGTSAAIKKKAARVLEIEKEIEATAVVFHFRAMAKDQYRVLTENSPPRKGNEIDSIVGFNRDAVEDAAVRACLFDPVFDDASWAELVKLINPSEWNELRDTVRSVNRGVVSAPKSDLASRILARGARTSPRPDPGE